MPKKRRSSVQEAEEEQVTGQATLIAVCKQVNKLCYYEIFIVANFLQNFRSMKSCFEIQSTDGCQKVVSHVDRITQAESFREQGDEEGI